MIDKLILLLLGMAMILIFLIPHIPKYQFFAIKVDSGYIQLRGNTLTGTLEQVFIK